MIIKSVRVQNFKSIRDEILEFLIRDGMVDEKSSTTLEDAEKKLRSIFHETGENYENPTYEAVLKSMKVLMSWELKSGIDTKTISKNFLKIAKKIKTHTDIC